jgi:hypothetical protein
MLISLCISFFTATSVSAQKISVTAKVDSTVLWIGDQTVLHWKLHNQKDKK